MLVDWTWHDHGVAYTVPAHFSVFSGTYVGLGFTFEPTYVTSLSHSHFWTSTVVHHDGHYVLDYRYIKSCDFEVKGQSTVVFRSYGLE